jgi:F-type H+-transporting ATPase subunit b
MEIISNIALISINETLLVQLLSFVVFMFILNRIMIRPLRGSMQAREHYIEALGTDISASQKEMEAIVAQIETQETAARQAAHAIQKDIVAQGSQEAQSILASAKKDVVQLRQQTRAEIDPILAQSRQSLEKEAAAIAVNFMEKALSRRVNP